MWNKRKLSTTAKFATWGCGFFPSRGKSRELRRTAGANKRCQGARMQRTQAVFCSQCTVYGVFFFATFANSYAYKFIVPKAHFHADTIGASPAVIACKTAKLFKFLYSPTQYSSLCRVTAQSELGM